jgi:hypothetical protein
VVLIGHNLEAIRVRLLSPRSQQNRSLTLYGTIKRDCAEQSAKIRLSNKTAGKPLRTPSNGKEFSDDRSELAHSAPCS